MCGTVHRRKNRSGDFSMSEDAPPYVARRFVCRGCGKDYSPPPEETEALAELERTFGLKPENASSLCDECGKAADLPVQ
jgi:hypothetical protein